MTAVNLLSFLKSKTTSKLLTFFDHLPPSLDSSFLSAARTRTAPVRATHTARQTAESHFIASTPCFGTGAEPHRRPCYGHAPRPPSEKPVRFLPVKRRSRAGISPGSGVIRSGRYRGPPKNRRRVLL